MSVKEQIFKMVLKLNKEFISYFDLEKVMKNEKYCKILYDYDMLVPLLEEDYKKSLAYYNYDSPDSAEHNFCYNTEIMRNVIQQDVTLVKYCKNLSFLMGLDEKFLKEYKPTEEDFKFNKNLGENEFIMRKVARDNPQWLKYCRGADILLNDEIMQFYNPTEEDLKMNQDLWSSLSVQKKMLKKDMWHMYYYRYCSAGVFEDEEVVAQFQKQLKEEFDSDLNFDDIRNVCSYLSKYNDEILPRCMSGYFFKDKYIKIFEEYDKNGKKIYPLLQIIGKSGELQEAILGVDDELFSFVQKGIKKITSEYDRNYDFSCLLYDFLMKVQSQDNKLLLDDIMKNIGTYSDENQEKILNNLVYYFSKNDFGINKNIETCEDVFLIGDYLEDYFDEVFQNEDSTIEELQNAILLKNYGFTREEAMDFVKKFVVDFDGKNMDLSEDDKKIVCILEELKHILKSDKKRLKLNAFVDSLENKRKLGLSVDKCARFESLVRKMYAKHMRAVLADISQFSEIQISGFVHEQGVYKAFNEENPQDFNILLTALGAYSMDFSPPDNYKDDFLRPKNKSHGMCTSLISNQMMGIARSNYACLGFSDFPLENLLLSAPFDITSSYANREIDTARRTKNVQYLFPNEMIDYTRHTHNEVVLERMTKDGKLQPDYSIFMCETFDYDEIKRYVPVMEGIKEFNVEWSDEEKNAFRWVQAKQASEDFGIPIVIVERKKIREHEIGVLDSMYKEFETGVKVIEDKRIELSNSERAKLIKDIFLRFENNRAGHRDYYVDDGFKEEDVQRLITKTMQTIDTIDDDLALECISSLVEWIGVEVEKRAKGTRAVGKIELGFVPSDFLAILNEKKNYIIHWKNGTKVDKKRYSFGNVLQEINNGFTAGTMEQQIAVMEEGRFDQEASSLSFPTEQYSVLDIKMQFQNCSHEVLSAINDPAKKSAYQNGAYKAHGSRHIDDVILFTALVGKDSLQGRNKDKLLSYALEAAKFHDCGRINDYDRNHAVTGADKAFEILKTSNVYTPLEQAIIYTAIYQHEFSTDDDVNSVFGKRNFEKNLKNQSMEIFKQAFMSIVQGKSPREKVSFSAKEYRDSLCQIENVGSFDCESLDEDLMQVVTCVRDADALDRTRFIRTSRAGLNPNYLSDSAKKYISFSYQLAEMHAVSDLSQMCHLPNSGVDENLVLDLYEHPEHYSEQIAPKTPKEIVKFIRNNVSLIENHNERKGRYGQ